MFAPADAHPGGGRDASFAVMHGLCLLTANLAEEPTLVVAVDDGHWSDRPSLRFLACLDAVVALGERTTEPGTIRR